MSTDATNCTIGVYTITNTVNGNVYVGSTAKSFAERWKGHRKELRRCVHGNRHLQSAWNKYGEAAFEFAVLEAVEDADQVIGREQHWIDHYMQLRSIKCYNILPNAGTTKGRKLPEYAKLNLAEKARGRKLSAETRAKISIAGKARRLTDEHKRKIGAAHTGRVKSEQEIRNMTAVRRARVHPSSKIYAGFVSPNGEVYRDILDLQAFCREHGLVYTKMVSVNSGSRLHSRGWTRIKD